jgi:LPS export ABC transporter protein LptC
MIHSRRILVPLLLGMIAASLIGVGWLFFKGRVTSQATVKLPSEAVRSLMKLAGVHQTATKNGAVQWELDAVTAELEAKSGRMVLDAPQVKFFLEDGTVVQVTAKTGILNTRSNDIQVRGNVKVLNDRYTLATEALSYKHGDRKMETEVPVIITGGEMDLRADAMTYDLDNNTARFRGHVVGNVNEDFSI